MRFNFLKKSPSATANIHSYHDPTAAVWAVHQSQPRCSALRLVTSGSLARITARVTLACSMLNRFAAYPGQFSPAYIETTLSLAVDASSCSWLATSLERSASHSCCGSLSTALIAADQPERDDPEAIEEKFEIIISSVTTALVSVMPRHLPHAPRSRSDYLSACTVARLVKHSAQTGLPL